MKQGKRALLIFLVIGIELGLMILQSWRSSALDFDRPTSLAATILSSCAVLLLFIPVGPLAERLSYRLQGIPLRGFHFSPVRAKLTLPDIANEEGYNRIKTMMRKAVIAQAVGPLVLWML